MRRQIALCIGNDDYQYSCLNKLECAVNDCNAIAEKLRTLNFYVKSYNNLDRDAMHTAVDDFEAQLPNYDIALYEFIKEIIDPAIILKLKKELKINLNKFLKQFDKILTKNIAHCVQARPFLVAPGQGGML